MKPDPKQLALMISLIGLGLSPSGPARADGLMPGGEPAPDREPDDAAAWLVVAEPELPAQVPDLLPDPARPMTALWAEWPQPDTGQPAPRHDPSVSVAPAEEDRLGRFIEHVLQARSAREPSVAGSQQAGEAQARPPEVVVATRPTAVMPPQREASPSPALADATPPADSGPRERVLGLLDRLIEPAPPLPARVSHRRPVPQPTEADAPAAPARPVPEITVAQAAHRVLDGLGELLGRDDPAGGEPPALEDELVVATQSDKVRATLAAILPPEPAPAAPFGPVASADRLDGVRGGFTTPSGLQFTFGIERAVYVNGDLVAVTTLNLSNLHQDIQNQVAQSVGGGVVVTPPVIETPAPVATGAPGGTGSVPSAPPAAGNAPGTAQTPPVVTAPPPVAHTPGAPGSPGAPAASSPVQGGAAAPAVPTPVAASPTPAPAPASVPATSGGPAPVIAPAPSVARPPVASGAGPAPSPVPAPAMVIHTGGPLGVVQIGGGNSLPAQGTLGAAAIGTVIQNSLNDQHIQNVLTVNATINSLQMLKSFDIQSAVRSAIHDALRR